MKLIMESWRQFLNERATDITYQKMVDFLIDTILSERFSDYAEEVGEIDFGDKTPTEWLASLGLFAPVSDLEKPKRPPKPKEFKIWIDEQQLEYLWNSYQKKVPRGTEIFRSYTDFYNMFHYLEIRIVHAPKDRKEEYEEYGEYRLARATETLGYFVANPDDMHELLINFANIGPYSDLEKYEKLQERDVLRVLRSYRNLFRTVVEHELVHLLNRLRAGNFRSTAKRKGLTRKARLASKKAKKQDQPDEEMSQETKALIYINSTEEIQARIIPLFQIVEKALRRPQSTHIDPKYVSDIEAIVSEVSDGNINEIIKHLLSLYEIIFPSYWENTRREGKQRIANRFYDFAERLIQRKDEFAATKT